MFSDARDLARPDPQRIRTSSGDESERVLVHHSFGRSAEVICRLLSENGIESANRHDMMSLARSVVDGAGAAVLGHNILTDDCTPLRVALEAQPEWSDLPVIVLVNAGQSSGALEIVADILGPDVEISVLEQPVRSFELVSFVKAALRTRRRQYQLRALLETERTLREEVESRGLDLQKLNETLEQRVEERSSKVRELSRALTRAEQQERRRIAQILHDDLQQQLYAVQMKVRFAQEDVEAGRRDEVLQNLEDAAAWLRQTSDVARNLTTELSPPVLESEGLTGTLEWVVAQMKQLYDLDIELVASHSFRMPDEDLRVLLFQIVRELLFNIVKHAETGAAKVTLTTRNGYVRVEVEDQGRGFDTAELKRRSEVGFGLVSARERLELFGGRLDIESHPGKGTRVTMELPVELMNPP